MRKSTMEFSLIRSILRILLSIILTLTILPSDTESAVLSRNGGYDLVLAIDELTPAPENIIKYQSNIQTAFQLFSTDLWRSTKQKFFINSIDLLLPTSWETQTDIATFQAYETADIKISNEFEAPRVENPNPCGATGQYIELPLEFFNNSRLVNNYGESSKALLNLFARYRFGVWEEHGEIDNENFPYFYMKPSLAPKWEVTGCTADVEGSILNEHSEESDDCYDRSLPGPSNNCRFKPSSTNKINSSLTFLPWANNVNQFCDHKNHNYGAPNRQNFYCSHRSVWDVIIESEDYWSVTEGPSDNLKVPTFRVFKTSSKPLFYLLLDRGRTTTSLNVLKEVQETLKEFAINQTAITPDIIAAVGTFPHMNAGRDHEYVKEEAPWSRLGADLPFFSSVIENSIGYRDGPVVRDFGEAIKEVVEKISIRNHKAGAVILIVKRGATQNGFDKLTYFGDVLSSVLEQRNIRLFGIEYQQTAKSPYINLQPLIAQTNGNLHVVNGTTNVRANLFPILNEIKEALKQPGNDELTRGWTVFKGFVQSGNPVEIPVLDSNLESMTICLTTKKYILQTDIEIVQTSGSSTPSEITVRKEWNEVADQTGRTVTIAKINNPPKDATWEVRVNNCHSNNPEDCLAFLVANVDLASETPEEVSLSNNLRINVHTSAENNYLDYDRRGAKIIPFSIFARVELQGQRAVNLEKVTATIVYNNQETWTIPLLDDGSEIPDVSPNDGIYSGAFTPPRDGLYRIYVSVTHHNRLVNEIVDEEESPDSTVNSLGRLIPIDQGRFGCKGSSNRRCSAASITSSLTRTADMIGTVYVAHSVTFLPRPMKIMDFRVITLANFTVRFAFTSPRVLGSDDQPDEYHIFMAPKIDNFLGGTEMTRLLVRQIGFPPGTPIEIRYPAMQQAIPFYTVEGVYKDQRGGPSNIVGVVTSEDGSPPTPQPTTTTTTTTTSTTTQAPTTSEAGQTSTTQGPSPTSTTEGPSPTSTTQGPITSPRSSTTPQVSTTTTSRDPPSSTEISLGNNNFNNFKVASVIACSVISYFICTYSL